MSFAIASAPCVPLRAEASERSEMFTQLLFGDPVEITGHEGNWVKLTSALDQYEGWADKKMFLECSQENYLTTRDQFSDFLVKEPLTKLIEKDGKDLMHLPGASVLPAFLMNGNIMKLAGKEWIVPETAKPKTYDIRKEILSLAFQYSNAPYLWGGKTLLGIDCSGLVQVVYRMCGTELPRDARHQVNSGKTVNFLQEAKPGDLAFFGNAEGTIVHVGIICGPAEILHASGKVHVDRLDHQGIYNENLKAYTHSLRLIKNVVGD
jgi:cell wall-associated NlpC family hydrolase